MKKSFLILMAAALIIPAFAFAAPGFHNPGHNGGFIHPSNGGGVAVHPGHSNNHGNNNNSGYNHGNNNNYGHNNNSGYNNGNNNNNHGHSNNNGYNNGHSNNSGYNNNPGHNNNSGYNNGNNNNHGHPGHYSPANAKVRMAHRAIKRAFQEAENSYYPFLMDQKDKRRMGMAMRTIASEIAELMRLVGPRFRDDLREVGMIIERAKFTLFSENNAREAHTKLQRAERKYDRIADIMIR